MGLDIIYDYLGYASAALYLYTDGLKAEKPLSRVTVEAGKLYVEW